MLPISGVVKSLKAGVLTILLESGLQVEVPQAFGLGVGDEAHITYDYTKNKMVRLLAPTSEESEVESEPPEEVEPPGEFEELWLGETSGALVPVGDECWSEDFEIGERNYEEYDY